MGSHNAYNAVVSRAAPWILLRSFEQTLLDRYCIIIDSRVEHRLVGFIHGLDCIGLDGSDFAGLSLAGSHC